MRPSFVYTPCLQATSPGVPAPALRARVRPPAAGTAFELQVPRADATLAERALSQLFFGRLPDRETGSGCKYQITAIPDPPSLVPRLARIVGHPGRGANDRPVTPRADEVPFAASPVVENGHLARVAPGLARGWFGRRSLGFRPSLSGSLRFATSLRPPAAPFVVLAAVVGSSPANAPSSLCGRSSLVSSVRSSLLSLRRVWACGAATSALRRVVF